MCLSPSAPSAEGTAEFLPRAPWSAEVVGNRAIPDAESFEETAAETTRDLAF